MLPTIVFVHLNSPIPFYLRFNIISTIKKFPSAKVVLIHNIKGPKKIHTHLEQFKYEPGETSKSIESLLQHPRNFRSNFWFSAIQRFDALRMYMEKFNEPIVHLESDVIISKDFPLKKFLDTDKKIAFPIVANNRGVASSVFIKDLETSENLVRAAKDSCLVNAHTTDMEILADFFENNQDKTMSLAFGPESIDAYHDNFKIESNALSTQTFKGIFDGNDIGVYLFGTDPRNARGISFMRTSIPGNYSKVDTWEFSFDNRRKFINLEFNGSIIPLYSVHATSKQLALFHHATQNLYIRKYQKKAYRAGDRRFSPFIALSMGVRKIVRLLKS